MLFGRAPCKILFMIFPQLQLLYRARFLLEKVAGERSGLAASLAPFAASKVRRSSVNGRNLPWPGYQADKGYGSGHQKQGQASRLAWRCYC